MTDTKPTAQAPKETNTLTDLTPEIADRFWTGANPGETEAQRAERVKKGKPR